LGRSLVSLVKHFRLSAVLGRPVEGDRITDPVSLGLAAVREWAEQRTRSETLAVTAFRIAELDGFDPPPPDDEVAFEARVAQLVADHVEPAKSKAYYELGDGRRGLSVAVAWLRPRVEGVPEANEAGHNACVLNGRGLLGVVGRRSDIQGSGVLRRCGHAVAVVPHPDADAAGPVVNLDHAIARSGYFKR
jgi:hypothetical protein